MAHSDGLPQTLASQTDGRSYAAKARAAEWKATRAGQKRLAGEGDEDDGSWREGSPPSVLGVPLGQWMTLKRHVRGRRGSKSPSLAEKQPPASDESSPRQDHHPQLGQSTNNLLAQYEKTAATVAVEQEEVPKRKRRSPRRAPRHPSTSFPPLVPHLDPPIHLSLPEHTLSPTKLSDCDRDTWPLNDSTDWNVVDPTKMPPKKNVGKGLSPATPSSETRRRAPKAARQASGRTLGDDNIESNVFHTHTTTGPVLPTDTSSHPSSQQSSKQRMPSHHSQGTSTSYPTASAPRISVIEDPFQDQSGQMANDFFTGSDAYYPSNMVYQPAYGQQYGYPPQGEYDQQTQYAQTSFDPQSAYGQQSVYESAQGQAAYPLQHNLDAQQSAYQQTQHNRHHDQMAQPQPSYPLPDYSRSHNSRTLPPAVKGTPGYDVRLALLHSRANETFLRQFYSWREQSRQGFLSHHFGPAEAESITDQDKSHVQGSTPAQSTQDMVRRSQQAAMIRHVRDPSPYTGFGAANKKDMLFQHLEKVAEAAKGQEAGSARTVLYDPVAQHHVNRSTSTVTASTAKPQGTIAQALDVHHMQSSQPLSTSYHEDLLTTSEAMPSTRAVGGDVSSSYHTALSNSHGSFQTAPSHASIANAVGGIQQPDALARLFDRVKRVHDNIQAGRHPYDGSILPGQPEVINEAQKHSQNHPISDTTTPPQQVEPKYTASGHPIPHGGFGDFVTPYNKNFMGKWSDYPEPFASQASENARHDLLTKKELRAKKDEGVLEQGCAWFREASSGNDQSIEAVATKLKALSAQVSANDFSSKSDAAKAKPLPTPIGHERAAAATAAKKAAETTIDLMKNPTAKDGIDLMSGTIANLAGYASGKEVGGHFANWTRPAEHAIHKSLDGNKSMFDKNWGTPPARVGRDPRYQQTMTNDGRATYFEDPVRGKGRQ